MEEEFNLSKKMVTVYCLKAGHIIVLNPKDVKEFIRLREKENEDLKEDVLSLVSISAMNPKTDMLNKLKILFEAHKQERDKLAGPKLTEK